jgi:hypothetical protein
MPLEAGYEEITTILTAYYSGDYEYLLSTYGDQAVSLAGEMGDMLADMLQADTPFGALWLEFTQSPDEYEAEIVGALEVLEEAFPEITIRLEGYYSAFANMAREKGEVVESGEPDDLVNIEELENVRSIDDGDDDDEYREDNEYLRGNVEDRSTSAMYFDDLDSSVEPNQTEDD